MPETMTEVKSKKVRSPRAAGTTAIVRKLLDLPTMRKIVAELVETDAEAAEIVRDKLSAALNKIDAPLPFEKRVG